MNEDGAARHWLLIECDVEVLAGFFSHGTGVMCVKGVPPDAKLVDTHYNIERRMFALVFEHHSFPLSLEGATLWRHAPEFKRIPVPYAEALR